jgi:hypothetical protein
VQAAADYRRSVSAAATVLTVDYARCFNRRGVASSCAPPERRCCPGSMTLACLCKWLEWCVFDFQNSTAIQCTGGKWSYRKPRDRHRTSIGVERCAGRRVAALWLKLFPCWAGAALRKPSTVLCFSGDEGFKRFHRRLRILVCLPLTPETETSCGAGCGLPQACVINVARGAQW